MSAERRNVENSLSESMLEKLRSRTESYRERRQIGIALGSLNVRRTRKPWEKERVEKDFAPIEQGKYKMGVGAGVGQGQEYTTNNGKKFNIQGWEGPAHEVSLSAYRISRYLVTNLDFSCFQADGGYKIESGYWEADGLKWRKGTLPPADLSYINNDPANAERNRVQTWLNQRTPTKEVSHFLGKIPAGTQPRCR